MHSTKILRWKCSFPKKFKQKLIVSVKVSKNAKNNNFKARRRRNFLGFYIHFFQIPLYFGRFRTAKSLTETGIHPSKPGSTKPGSTKTGVHQTGVHQSRLLRKPRSTKPRSTKIFRKNRGPWTPGTAVNRGPSTTLSESVTYRFSS